MPRRQPFDYQSEDAWRLIAGHDDALGLASDPGTGKTFTSLLAAHRLGVKRLLVFCPAVARPVWEVEAKEFDDWRVVRLDKNKKADLSGNVLVIVSYEHAVASASIRDRLMTVDEDWDVMICDEAHYLKNPRSKRTEFVYGVDLSMRVNLVWPLSGTFMLNHPGELWPHINRLDPERIGWLDYFHFTRKYCRFENKRVARGRTVEMIVGADKSNAPELKERLTGMFIRRKADVNNLPELNFQLRPVELANADAETMALFAEDNPDNEAIRRALQSEDPVQALNGTDAHLARIRTAVAMAKIPGTVDYVRDILKNTDEKILLWCWHMAPFDKLLTELADDTTAVSIRGETTSKARERAVTMFQNDPNCRVFVGQIQAAGTAITLTSGSREIFLEQAYTPALNFQAAKRAHRIGQTRSVLVETMYVPDSIDEAILRMLNGKLADIRAMEGAI